MTRLVRCCCLKGQDLGGHDPLSHVAGSLPARSASRLRTSIQKDSLAAVPNPDCPPLSPQDPRRASFLPQLPPGTFVPPYRRRSITTSKETPPRTLVSPVITPSSSRNGYPRGPKAPGPNGGPPHLIKQRGRIPRHNGPDHQSTCKSWD